MSGLLTVINTRTALAAVMAAPDVDTARAVARDELARLDALAAGESDLLGISEAAEMVGRNPSTVRRWAEKHRLGRKLGTDWLLSRRRFVAFVDRGCV